MSARTLLRLAAALGLAMPAPAAATEAADAAVQGAAALRHWVQPEFPAAARRQKLPGRVLLEFVVAEDGRVADPRVLESTAGMFEEAALAAVGQWIFAPALDDGRPVRSALRVEIEFPLAQLTQRRPPIAPPPHQMPRPPPLVPPRPLAAAADVLVRLPMDFVPPAQ